MKHFLVKLIPPRPAFHKDMSEGERLLMEKHSVYWKELQEHGIAYVYGPVFDPRGVWGMGVIEALNEETAREIISKDPSMQAQMTFELIPMNAYIKK